MLNILPTSSMNQGPMGRLVKLFGPQCTSQRPKLNDNINLKALPKAHPDRLHHIEWVPGLRGSYSAKIAWDIQLDSSLQYSSLRVGHTTVRMETCRTLDTLSTTLMNQWSLLENTYILSFPYLFRSWWNGCHSERWKFIQQDVLWLMYDTINIFIRKKVDHPQYMWHSYNLMFFQITTLLLIW